MQMTDSSIRQLRENHETPFGDPQPPPPRAAPVAVAEVAIEVANNPLQSVVNNYHTPCGDILTTISLIPEETERGAPLHQIKTPSKFRTLRVALNYLISDIKKKPKSFKIGLFSISLVVGFLATIQSAFSLSPILFLSIAENQTGDADFILTPKILGDASAANFTNIFDTFKLLNHTLISQICESTESIQGCAPRWILPATISNTNSSQNSFTQRSLMIAINPKEEKSIGLGRKFKEELIEEGEAYLTASAVRGLGLEIGQNATININFIDVLVNYDVIQKNSSLTNNQTVFNFISEQIQNLLVEQYDIFTTYDQVLSVVSAEQLKTIVGLLKQITEDINDPEKQKEVINQIQSFMLQIGIQGNATQILTPYLEDPQLVSFVESITQTINDLPDDYTFSAKSAAEAIALVITNTMNLEESVIIKSSVENTQGKWAGALGNVIILDAKYIFERIWRNISRKLTAQFNDADLIKSNLSLQLMSRFYQAASVSDAIEETMTKVNILEYAFTSNVVVKDKMSIYESKESIKEMITQISNEFIPSVQKVNYVNISILLSQVINTLLIIKLFLDNMTAICVVILMMLSIILIYSLMISDIDEKTYDFAMLRTLGLEKKYLICLMVSLGLSFGIPGFVIGYIIAYLANSFISYLIFNESFIMTTYQLDTTAIILAIVIGICIPLVSVYLPIRKALSKTLRDSLDLYNRVVSEMHISVEKLEKLGLSFSQTMNGIILVFLSILSYYFAPHAYVYEELGLFLTIINVVLIFMMLGLTVLLNMAQPYLEKLFVRIFLVFIKPIKHMYPIIVKNMSGHNKRNQKTALMYSVTLSFLIFAGTGFNLQGKSISDNIKNYLGSDIKIQLSGDKTGLDEYNMRLFLDGYMQQNPNNILGYSFITLGIHDFPFLQSPQLSALSGFSPAYDLVLYGVESNYLSSTYLDFYFPSTFNPEISFPDVDDHGVYDKKNVDAVAGLFNYNKEVNLTESLDVKNIISNTRIRNQARQGGGYFIDQDNNDFSKKKLENTVSFNRLKEREINFIISTGIAKQINVKAGELCISDFDRILFRSRITAIANKFPGFSFSAYPSYTSNGDIITGLKQFRLILDYYYLYKGWTDTPEVQSFYKNIQTNSTEEREYIKNNLRNFFKSDFTLIFDVPSILESIEEATQFLNLFSIVVASVSMILSFFLILVSFTANIKENSWEFGVLRAVGLNKEQITGVYMVESCSLILASGFIGSIIGIAVAITLTLQILMFTELPFQFEFPYVLFGMTFLSGLLISSTATYLALKDFKDKPISQIVKGLL